MLTRNIVIKGDSTSQTTKFGAHMMAMSGQLHLSEVEFVYCGQKLLKSRYPVHFHLAGNLMTDSWIKNLAIHESYSR